jgi:hypothetical protein
LTASPTGVNTVLAFERPRPGQPGFPAELPLTGAGSPPGARTWVWLLALATGAILVVSGITTAVKRRV